ncbi:MAG: NADP-specific glutamate dehydrogenase [Clostridia bacterium]|jgi:glutamate dehydrogenase (NADP+)|nr:NADP-specific glutamate dehydrogenase [Oscillospiraceae bacterium]MBQ4103124.1 NADP-specific glutamate dehydrogenase [Clostridia bacterium]
MSYVQRVIDDVAKKHANEPEFVQTVTEVLTSLEPVIEQNPEYEKYSLLERIVEPERQITFRVTWTDDKGKVHVNTGYRVQFNGAIGPYKGGLRFHPSVYSGIMKFLAFEQTFKNSLTGLPIGGGKGGSDFDPRGKSDMDILRFCQSFMTELYRHIGPDVDVPAGDIGVGAREIGYLYGQYRRIKGAFKNGVLTGKGLSYGGSLVRPEATGFGATYYAVEVFKHFGEDIKGKTFALSGFGNVAWGAAKKISELGGKVLTISGPDGYVYDPDGISTDEKIEYMLEMRASGRDKVQDYADKFGCQFFPGEKPWGVKVDVAMPCATQNEINMDEAKKLVANGVQYYIEVANMPTTNDALEYLKENVKVVAPSKAVNAGGVAVSALEMGQNSMRYNWTAEEVDARLQQIMKDIHDHSAAAAEKYGLGYDLVAGANIAGFVKVADAMMAQGII